MGGGDYPAAGSGDTLCRSLSPYNDLSKIAVMASMRMVVDLGDEDRIMGVLPGGSTGRLLHPHTTDQIAPFINGDQVYWWYSDSQIKSHARHELILTPGGKDQ
jgi:penicillin amidase